MTKRGVYLYLDSDIIEKLKRDGINISEKVNDFLWTLSGKETNTEELRKQAEIAKIKAADLERLAVNAEMQEQKAITIKANLLSNPKFQEHLKIIKARGEVKEADLKWIKGALGVKLTLKELEALINA